MAGPRLFDHDDAVRRHQAGESTTAIARSLGVTQSAIWQAVKRATDPAYAERDRKYNREHQRATRRTLACKGCGKTIWKNVQREQTGLCQTCLGIERAESVRADTLRCSECREWKPDQEFPQRRDAKARRGRHQVCRGCQAVVRQRARLARTVPCSQCGKPRTNPKDDGERHRSTGLCLACYRVSDEFRNRLAKARRAAASKARRAA